jgi:hypothetical protein
MAKAMMKKESVGWNQLSFIKKRLAWVCYIFFENTLTIE